MGAMGPLSLSLSPFAHRAPIEDKYQFPPYKKQVAFAIWLGNAMNFHLYDV